MVCEVCGTTTEKAVFGHEWCDTCKRCYDVSGPRPFALYDVFRTGDLTVAHAKDIKSRGCEMDGEKQVCVRRKPRTIYTGGVFNG